MSTLQHTKPRHASQSMTEESGRPGTVRSNVGCDAIDEPCTKSTTGLPCGDPTNFSQRNRRTSRLNAQCSTPSTLESVVAALSISPFNSRSFCHAWSQHLATALSSVDLRARVADDLRPQILFRPKEAPEF